MAHVCKSLPDARRSLPSVVASFTPIAIVAVASNWTQNPFPMRQVLTLWLGIIPGTLSSSLLLALLPKLFIPCATALIACASGAFTLRRALATCREELVEVLQTRMPTNITIACKSPTPSEKPASISEDGLDLVSTWTAPASWDVQFYVVLGVIIGSLSVLTGTGGPFIAIPLLFTTQPHLPSSQVVALAQTAGIPIGVISSLTLVLHNMEIDIGLVMAIAGSTSLGIPAGVRLARNVRPSWLKLTIGLLLLSIGLVTFYSKVLQPRYA